tara:strand:+ start:486 stop:716 length:231 start_codon:yes stop_codon:yes gene_type:complete
MAYFNQLSSSNDFYEHQNYSVMNDESYRTSELIVKDLEPVLKVREAIRTERICLLEDSFVLEVAEDNRYTTYKDYS